MTTSARSVALTFGCISLLTSFSILAHEAGKGDENYVGDGSKHLITDGFGNCVRTGTGDKNAPCGEVAKAPEPEPAPETAPVAVPEPEPAVPQTVTKAISDKAGALFDVNSAKLKPAGMAALDQLISEIRAMQSVESINIVGHTDSTGAAAYNQTLSEKRARAARDYMVQQGIDPSLISTSGMGETQPVADNKTRAGRAQNRRVDVTIKGTVTE